MPNLELINTLNENCNEIVTIQNINGIYYLPNNQYLTNTCSTVITSSTIFNGWFNNATVLTTSTTLSTWTGTSGIYYVNYSDNYTPVKEPPRKPIKAIRSSIKKALKLISNFGMEEDIRIFLGGNSVEVSHPDSMFKFVIKKKYNNLIRATEFPSHSTPYELKLFTKTDIHLADLCIYVRDTPLLDQVLSLAMFIKSGNEDEILKKANYFSKNKDKLILESVVQDVPYLENKLTYR